MRDVAHGDSDYGSEPLPSQCCFGGGANEPPLPHTQHQYPPTRGHIVHCAHAKVPPISIKSFAHCTYTKCTVVYVLFLNFFTPSSNNIDTLTELCEFLPPKNIYF